VAAGITVSLEDRMRSRVYKGLLLFILLAGLPAISIPKLRNRLSGRIQVLRTAWMQNEPPSVTQAGASSNPFPQEYERQTDQNTDKTQLSAVANFLAKHRTPVSEGSPIKVIKVLQSPKKAARASLAFADNKAGEMERASPQDSSNSIPQYKQGENEKKAYDLVLKSNKTLAEMVQGGNPSLHLKSWGAAYRGEDSYWIRVVFLNQEKTEVEYIWQVKLASGEISPLSYNARSIS
jgi:hypothetical protein